jgi:CubicO group peptidase (beta-lactamase class C family)
VLDVAEEGKLSLDAPITEHLPDLQASCSAPSALTLAHLLTQTSSYDGGPIGCVTLEESIATDGLILAPPGRIYAWNPQNWLLAGLAVQRQTGPFAETVRARVLTPLGMTGSFEPSEVKEQDHALPHGDWMQEVDYVDCPNQQPSHQYFGSISDLAKIAAMLTGAPGPLEPESLEKMLTPQGPHFYAADFTTYGLEGRHLSEDVLYVSGSAAGFTTELVLFPARGWAFISLLNRAIPNATPITLGFASAFIPDLPAPDVELTPECDHSAALGTYAASSCTPDDGRRITLEQQGCDLIAQYWIEPKPATPSSTKLEGLVGKDTFAGSFDGAEARLRIWRDAAGQAELISFWPGQGAPLFRVP